MSNFWVNSNGAPITGNADKAFLGDFSLIPDGTSCKALIKSFKLVQKEDYKGDSDEYYEIKWRLIDGEFKDREVPQKLKVFLGKSEAIDRNKEMMMLIMNMFNYQMNHDGILVDDDLRFFVNKIASVVIGSWVFPTVDKKTGKEMMLEGNNIKEVHPAGTIETITGLDVSKKNKSSPVESALTRNSSNKAQETLNDQIPF